MNTILKIFLSMSFSGGLLVLILFLIKGFLKDKISRQWQYYIWLIVILRLLLPFRPETNLLGEAYQALDQAITHTAPLPPSQSPQNTFGGTLAFDVSPEPNNENINGSKDDLAAAHPFQDIRAMLTDHVWVIWLAAALGLLIRKVTIYQGFVRYISAGLTPVSDIEMLDRLSVAQKQAGVQKPVELCVNPLISSPLLIGFFHPCIVLPKTDIPQKDFQYIVLHELTHYKRQDLLYKWLVQITVCLHWFNPLVHLMGREITRACEFSCDEAVLGKMGGDSAPEYGKTLLDAMAAVGKYKENLGTVMLSENKRFLKERLSAIMKFKKPSKKVRMLTAMLTLCVTLGAAFIGVYTMEAAAQGTVPSGTLPDTEGQFSLSLDVSSAAVNVLPAANNKISADYNSEVYMVDINEQGSDWKVSVSCKTRTNTNDETIRLYIPDIDYGRIKLSADSGHLTCDFIRSGNIVGNFNMASVFLTLKEGFSGSVDATVNGGYFQLVSRDDFRNTTTTITDDGQWGEIYKPKNFKQNGNVSTFSDGTGANVIQITRKGSGVMGIYASNAFDTWNFQDEWKDLWFPQSSTETEQYYEAGSLPLFEIAFQRLDEEDKKTWLDKLYADDDVAFFSVAVRGLDETSSLIDDFADKAYADGKISFFSVMADCMGETRLNAYLDRALKDEKWNFQSILYNKLNRGEEFDQLISGQEKEWEESNIAKYQAVGVTMSGKNYYYQGQLVNIFLDIVRSDKSFYILNMNPAGTVNIKIIRDANNEITGVTYMTEEEITQLFGE